MTKQNEMNALQTSTKIAISDFKYDPTVKMLFISKRMIDENERMDSNSDFVEQIKESFGIAR